MRHVRGILFLDYVRMLKSHKGVDWAHALRHEDLRYLSARIDPDVWYPMDSFERMGNAILRHIAKGQLLPVQLWGRLSASQLGAAHPNLLSPGDPVETLNRFCVLRATFFDFEAIEVAMLHAGEANIIVHYYMGMPAEEAATYQTLGFFEALLELAGAKAIRSVVRQKSWAGDSQTLLELRWTDPQDR